MSLTLLKIGTKHYWRDETTRCYRAIDNPHQTIAFDSIPAPDATPQRAHTPGPVEAPYYCAACGQSFVGPCNCQNTPEAANAHRRKNAPSLEP